MALTSAERRSFQRIAAQLRASDRLLFWRTRPTTRRGLWLRRQVCHVLGPPLAVWALVIAVAGVVTGLVGAGRAAIGQGTHIACGSLARALSSMARAVLCARQHWKSP